MPRLSCCILITLSLVYKNYKMRNFLTIISCIFFSAKLIAQNDTISKMNCNITLEGRVLDEHDKTSLDFANIFLIEPEIVVNANEKGHYKINNICPGIYTIKITHLSCEPIIQKIELKTNTKKNFYLEHHAELLKGIDIVAKKTADQSTQTKTEISTEKLNQSKGLSLGEALKNIAGVTSLNTGNSISKPVIHGMHSNRILILNNGIRQEGQQWGVEHAPEIDPFIANKISVVKGANSVRYGSDAIAGVVLVDTKPLRDSAGIGGELNLIGMSNGKSGTTSAYLEGNFNKLKAFSWRVQGTLKKGGTISAPNYNLVNTSLNEYNFSYNLGWKKPTYGVDFFYSQFNTTLGIFGASHIGNLTDLQKAFNSSAPLYTGEFTYKIERPYQHIEHELFKVKAFLVTGNVGKIYLTYARQYNLRNEFDKHRPRNDSLAKLNLPELEFELTSHSTDIVWEHNSIKRFTGSIGISGFTQGNTYSGRVLIPNYRNYNGGIYLIERWRKNKIEIEGGLRYDYRWLQIFKYTNLGNANYELVSPIQTFENFTENLGFIYKKDSTLNFSINLGSAWRAPSVNELYTDGLHHGAAALEYGNDKLKSERTYNIIFTTRYVPNKKLFIEISPFYHHIKNFIFRQPSLMPVLTIHGAFPAFFFKQTDANLYGCDFYINYKLVKQLELISKASLLRAWNRNENTWLILMPSDRYEAEILYRFHSFKKVKSSYISASSLFVTKQWRVPANSDFAPPPAQYYLLNIHASCSIEIKNQVVELGISVFNALNKSYRDYLDRFRYFTDAMGRNVAVRLKLPINYKSKK